MTTPNELALEVGRSPKTVRAFLREEYPDHELGTDWDLNDAQAAAVRRRFVS
jgi:predicted transcriptional regulator